MAMFLKGLKVPFPQDFWELYYLGFIEEHKLKSRAVERSVGYAVSSHVGKRNFGLGTKIRVLSHFSASEKLCWSGRGGIGEEVAVSLLANALSWLRSAREEG